MVPRGIIITPTNLRDNTTVPPFVEPGFLRKCLLYWDMIDCPDDAIGSLNVIPESDNNLLIGEGILQRTKGYLFYKEDGGHILLSFFAEKPFEFYTLAQAYALKKHYLSGLPERWSLGHTGTLLKQPDPAVAQFLFLDREGVGPQKPNNILAVPNNQIYHPDKDSELKTSLGIEIFNALPVPSPDTPIKEIIQFKRKRWDELLRFRHALDGLCEHALNSQDIPSSIEYAVDEIDASLKDIHKTMNESFVKRFVSTIKIELNINDLVVGALAGGLLGQKFELPQIGIALGMTFSAIKISLDSSLLKPKGIPLESKDYEYLYYANTEIGASN